MSENNGFKKGREKTGGRKKGTPNRTTKESREAINRLVTLASDELEEKIQSLDAKELVDLISTFAPYLIVKKNELGLLGDFYN